MVYEKEDCINALQKINKKIGKSPTHNEWREQRKEEDLPSYGAIIRLFGSWNNAKEEANLSKHPQNKPKLKKPSNVSMSDKEWEKLENGKRTHINRVAMLAKYKVSKGCKNCGYNKNEAALEFHHPNGRKGEYKHIKSQPYEEMVKEIEECHILCGNCHNIEHREKDYIIQ